MSIPTHVPGWDLHSLSSDTCFVLTIIRTGLATEMPMTITTKGGKMTIKMGKIKIAEGRDYKSVREQFDLVMAKIKEGSFAK